MVKVLISEWARKAAHELDDWRDRWLASKEKDIYADGLLQKVNIKGEIVHDEVLSTEASADRYCKLATEDIHILQGYLALMKGWKIGGGKWKIESRYVSKQEFNSHRSAVIEELNYKHRLVATAREARSVFRSELFKNERRYISRPTSERSPFKNREERLTSLNQHFVDAARNLLESDVFESVLLEAKTRLKAFEDEFFEGRMP